jgi:hypothetical protein
MPVLDTTKAKAVPEQTARLETIVAIHRLVTPEPKSNAFKPTGDPDFRAKRMN